MVCLKIFFCGVCKVMRGGGGLQGLIMGDGKCHALERFSEDLKDKPTSGMSGLYQGCAATILVGMSFIEYIPDEAW